MVPAWHRTHQCPAPLTHPRLRPVACVVRNPLLDCRHAERLQHVPDGATAGCKQLNQLCKGCKPHLKDLLQDLQLLQIDFIVHLLRVRHVALLALSDNASWNASQTVLLVAAWPHAGYDASPGSTGRSCCCQLLWCFQTKLSLGSMAQPVGGCSWCFIGRDKQTVKQAPWMEAAFLGPCLGPEGFDMSQPRRFLGKYIYCIYVSCILTG